jgi:hypothetical protein
MLGVWMDPVIAQLMMTLSDRFIETSGALKTALFLGNNPQVRRNGRCGSIEQRDQRVIFAEMPTVQRRMNRFLTKRDNL